MLLFIIFPSERFDLMDINVKGSLSVMSGSLKQTLLCCAKLSFPLPKPDFFFFFFCECYHIYEDLENNKQKQKQ